MYGNHCFVDNILNCSNGCYVCHLDDNNIEQQHTLFPYCQGTEFCISNKTICDQSIIFDNCVISNNVFKAFAFFFVFMLFNFSFRRITRAFKVYKYNQCAETIILSLYTIINIIIPFVLLFVTKIIYFEYCFICILSFIFVVCCIPDLERRRFLLNRNFNNRDYESLSSNLPITPTSINSVEDETLNQENNNQIPTIQYQT